MVANLNLCSTNDTGVDTPRAIGKKEKKLVIIEWVDIISDDGWVIAEDCHLPTVYSVGWLENEAEKLIKISNKLDFDDALEEHKKKDKPIGYSVTCFPTGCVTEIREVTSDFSGSRP